MISLCGTAAEEAIAPLVDAECAPLIFLKKMPPMTLTTINNIIRYACVVKGRFGGEF